MRFGILGPTQVWHGDGREVPVGGRRLRALLALLLVDAGKVVTAERLIDGLYGGNPPGDAANALQSQVSRLRSLLREEDRPGSPVESHPAAPRQGAGAASAARPHSATRCSMPARPRRIPSGPRRS